MNDAQLHVIHGRWAKATPGPWYACSGMVWGRFSTDLDECSSDCPSLRKGINHSHCGHRWKIADMAYHAATPNGEEHRNAEAIAAAPTDVPALLAEVRRLRAALGEIESGAPVEDGSCDWCSCPAEMGHYDDCPITIARATLAPPVVHAAPP